ncbi:MAG: hypothetical protein JXR37_36395 [Kiritimatiellae bacterium]|nr:hypothetical protein [Kiritimatiellia bacterium]
MSRREGWKDGRVEGWKNGGVEGWKAWKDTPDGVWAERFGGIGYPASAMRHLGGGLQIETKRER